MKLFVQAHGDGFPLVILHGLFGSSDNWQTLAKRFAAHFRVYTIDLRNHGRSPHSEIQTYAAMSGDVLEVFQDHGLSEAFILGHSMGGKTAMRCAFDHPTIVKKLVVVDIAPKEYPAQHDHILEALLGLDLAKHDSRNEIDQSLALRIPSSATRQFLMKNLQRTEEGFAWKINLKSLNASYPEMNRAVSGTPFPHPALFLHSLTSDYVRQEDLPSIRVLFPAARFVGLNVGHWIHAEAPDDFFQVVLDFLQRDS